MGFRAGLFSDGTLTVQKGHGAVELDPEEALQLLELLAPRAARLAGGKRW
jgi:hypothetical protein